MSDLIDRQKAIEAITKYANEHTFNSYYKGMLKAMNIVDALPSVEEHKWIPINSMDDLPKDRILWVSVDIDGMGYVTRLYYDMTEWSNDTAARYAVAYMDYKEPKPYSMEEKA